MSLRNHPSIEHRRIFVEQATGVSLSPLAVYPHELEVAAQRNCENMIGAVQIPVGVAGPLLIHGDVFTGEVYVPLATTEAALIASLNRGCKAITQAGGAIVVVEDEGITRAPVFVTSGLRQSMHLRQWLQDSFSRLQQLAATTSSHIKLVGIQTHVVGKTVYVRFSYHTGDAMGMNMATSATAALADAITAETGAECLALAGNYDTDKKPAWINAILGRGKQGWAEVVLSRFLIETLLKTTPEKLHEVCLKKCQLGSGLSGAIGTNAHSANSIAALFLATGQDPAHVVEGSLAVTTTDRDTDGVRLAVYLPALVMGTVGGGTGLPAQQAALAMMGIAGGNDGKNARKFAEIIAATVLAGELSLLSSLAEGSLARTHETLAGKRSSGILSKKEK